MAEADLFIGIDVGTTAIKAGLFSADGRASAHDSVRYPTTRPAPGLAEQDPDDWVRGIDRVIDLILQGQEPSRVAAVGLCSQVNTDVFVDASGRPLAPAIVWQDGRAATEAAELDAGIDIVDKIAWWGAPLPIGASHVLARMAWMQRHRPPIFAATRHVLSPKDYCLMALAGVAVSDPMSSFFIVGQDLRYVAPLLDRLAGAAERLPPLRGFTDVVGEIRLGSSGCRAPVVAGTMDAWSGAFGSGIHRAGQGSYISGTSEILCITTQDRLGAPGVVTFPTAVGLNLHAGPTQSGGDSLTWWADANGGDVESVLRQAALADRRGRPMLFLPHLEGERAPLWDPQLRGAFVGIDRRAGAADFALAVLEGVALSARLLGRSLDAATTAAPDRRFIAGGGARSDLWCQIRADCLGKPLDRVAFIDVGCLGAAMMASVGAGAHATLDNAVQAMTRVADRFEPDAAMASRYDALFEAYGKAAAALRPLGLIGMEG